MRYLFAAAFALAATTGAAKSEIRYFHYGDWTAVIDVFDTEDERRTVCTAKTGGDGLPSLNVSISDGDVLPPDAFPSVFLSESAPRGYHTAMREGDSVIFRVEGGSAHLGLATAWTDEEGIGQAEALLDPRDNQFVLREMRVGDRLEVVVARETVFSASLSGFTAAYGKIAEGCGFTTIGVVD